jgi:quercetin dioxygenase-like cupin family protein
MPTTDIRGQDSRELLDGKVLRRRDMCFERHGSYKTCRLVGPDDGATQVALEVVRVPPGGHWQPDYRDEENTVVVFSGAGHVHVGDSAARLRRAVALYAPTGRGLEAWADRSGELILYVWRSLVADAGPAGSAPRTVSSLWNADTQLRGFAGSARLVPGTPSATMNFIFWPGTGSPCLSLHCGIQQPGETFSIHAHPASEEAFIAVEGVGQMYLGNGWVDVAAGDALFAPAGVPHGARNPHAGPSARRFVTCGGPTPFDPSLYDSAGVSAEVC